MEIKGCISEQKEAIHLKETPLGRFAHHTFSKAGWCAVIPLDQGLGLGGCSVLGVPALHLEGLQMKGRVRKNAARGRIRIQDLSGVRRISVHLRYGSE